MGAYGPDPWIALGILCALSMVTVVAGLAIFQVWFAPLYACPDCGVPQRQYIAGEHKPGCPKDPEPEVGGQS